MRTQAADRLSLPEAPAIPGLVFRRYRGEDDLPGMVRASNASRDAAGVEEHVTLAGMRNEYAHLAHCDPERDIVVVELDGTVVAHDRVEWWDQTDGSRSYEAWCVVDPAVRGRGIGSTLLAWSERRRREVAAAHPADRSRLLGGFAWDGDPAGRDLLERAGYRAARRFFDMVRPTLDAIPDVPLPEGFVVRPVEAAHIRQVYDADTEAFLDHWGEIDGTDETYAAFLETPGFDPSLWQVAWHGDEIAGFVINVIDPTELESSEDWPSGRRRGLLDSVAVRRPWRRRGLARALIVRSLRAFRERAMTSAWLGVDAENPHQALGLYESCGFVLSSSSTAYRKPLDREVSR